MVEEKNPNEPTIVAGDFSLKNKLKKLLRGKKTKSQVINNPVPLKSNNHSIVAKSKIMIFLVLVLIVVLSYTAYNKYKKSSAKCIGESCSIEVHKPFIEEAVNEIVTNNSQALSKTVEKIQKIPKYQEDVDYLFIIVQYNISIGNASEAKINYTNLEKLYLVADGYQDSALRGVAHSPDSLKADIEFLDKQSSDAGSYDKLIHSQ